MYMATALLATTLYGLQMVELGSLGDPEYLPHDSKVNENKSWWALYAGKAIDTIDLYPLGGKSRH